MKKPAHPGELVAANLKELGLSVVEAEKAIGVIRQQLYNVINGRSAVTPEMAVRFEKALGGDVWLRMQATTTSRKCASPKERSEYDALPGRYDGSHFRPALVERVAPHDDRDWNANAYRGTPRLYRYRGMVAVTGTAT
jgi:antitoxin HigA-1